MAAPGVNILSLGVNIVFGILGNGFYMKRIHRLILESQSLLGQVKAAHAQKYGGTSGLAVVLLIGGLVVLYIILFAAFYAAYLYY
jgi:hypothetical protein